MPDGLRRCYGRGGFHFLTFSCCQRRPFLETQRARNLFVQELARVREQFGFLLLGYVVMPEHVHLLISEPAKGTPSTVLQLLKQRVSRKLRPRNGVLAKKQSALPFESYESGALPFWQARFYDFNVYSRGKIKEKLNYMHANPVIRKLVSHPKDWPWSSWSDYAKGVTGLIPLDKANW